MQFMINAMTDWIIGWKARNWTTAAGKDVINKLDFLALEQAMKGIKVTWRKVKAHLGIYGN